VFLGTGRKEGVKWFVQDYIEIPAALGCFPFPPFFFLLRGPILYGSLLRGEFISRAIMVFFGFFSVECEMPWEVLCMRPRKKISPYV